MKTMVDLDLEGVRILMDPKPSGCTMYLIHMGMFQAHHGILPTFENIRSHMNRWDPYMIGRMCIIRKDHPHQPEWGWEMGSSNAEEGYGPLSYQLMMSYAAEAEPEHPFMSASLTGSGIISRGARDLWNRASRDPSFETRKVLLPATWGCTAQIMDLFQGDEGLTFIYRLTTPHVYRHLVLTDLG